MNYTETGGTNAVTVFVDENASQPSTGALPSLVKPEDRGTWGTLAPESTRHKENTSAPGKWTGFTHNPTATYDTTNSHIDF